MQIGLPTDVKHVAHIGWDGPSVNSAPSWVNLTTTKTKIIVKNFILLLPSKGKRDLYSSFHFICR